MLSIIIPTLNEEKYLPLLLKSIKKQSFKDYEIIISDARSQDQTRKIAEKYGCKVANGGLPAKGRNQGAEIAKANLFLFLDAETLLPKDFLENSLKEFEKRNLDIAGCRLKPIQEQWMSKLLPFQFGFDLLYNWPAMFLEGAYPYAASFILIKREIHERLNGFDESIKIAEDHHYVREAAKIGKFGILRFSKLPLFLRRFKKEGGIKTGLKYLFCNLFNIFFGQVRTNIFHYNFGQYKKEEEKKKERKTNFFFHSLWILFCYVFAFLALLKWLFFFIIFTPKLITNQIKTIDFSK